ncbi:metallophosphoesterase family protein [Mycolicibacterium palauense]|uniref:metallophosphoesterase family protein n=1 Tax=Mycolicibacterium palauense TaxID=2034511 RepID=UPI000BFEBE0C|nr:metallophosphoesterase [Mycolicibacterium palauense]
MTNKVAVVGDWHGNSTWASNIVESLAYRGVELIIHAGDFGWWGPGLPREAYLSTLNSALSRHDMELWWVDGNHEYHPEIVERVAASGGEPWSDPAYPRIKHLPRGYRWELGGYMWMAMGGAHSIDRQLRKPGVSWWDEEHITEAEVDRAISAGPVHVVVSHDCPLGVDIPGIAADPDVDSITSGWPRSEIIASNAHRAVLRKICDGVRPRILIHGHYHKRYNSLLQYPDGTATRVFGLAEDGTHQFSDNFVIWDLG